MQRNLLAGGSTVPGPWLTNATDETAPSDGQSTPSKPAETPGYRPRGNPCRRQPGPRTTGRARPRRRAAKPRLPRASCRTHRSPPASADARHPDHRVSGGYGLIAPGRTGPRPLCHRPTPSSARQPASGRHGRGRWTPGFAPMAAGRYELASQSDGLGFRGVRGRENASLTEELTAELAGILS